MSTLPDKDEKSSSDEKLILDDVYTDGLITDDGSYYDFIGGEDKEETPDHAPADRP